MFEPLWLLTVMVSKTRVECGIATFAYLPHAVCYCSMWWISQGRSCFPSPTDAELSAMPFILKNIGLYTSVKLRVPEEKQDQSPSPLCVVIKPTAGSSHYAIRVSRWTWSVTLEALHLTSLPATFFLSSAPVHCKEAVLAQRAVQLTVRWSLWVFVVKHFGVTHHLLLPQCTFSHCASLTVLAGTRWRKCPHVVLGSVKFTPTLYIWQETTWKCGIMENRQVVRQPLRGRQHCGQRRNKLRFHQICTPETHHCSPSLTDSLTHSPPSHITTRTLRLSRNFNVVPLCVCPHNTKHNPVPKGYSFSPGQDQLSDHRAACCKH